MKECNITKEQAIFVCEEIVKYITGFSPEDAIKSLFEKVEAEDVVKITRCENCKHGHIYKYTDGKSPAVVCYHEHSPCKLSAFNSLDWFCPLGEPKDEEVKQDD